MVKIYNLVTQLMKEEKKTKKQIGFKTTGD